MSSYQIGRHRKTGTFHAMMGPEAAICSNGGLGRSMRLRPAAAEEVAAAAPTMFCTRCFKHASLLDKLKSELAGGAA